MTFTCTSAFWYFIECTDKALIQVISLTVLFQASVWYALFGCAFVGGVLIFVADLTTQSMGFPEKAELLYSSISFTLSATFKNSKYIYNCMSF